MQVIVLCRYKSSDRSLLAWVLVYHAANALRLLQKVKDEDCLPLPDRKGCLSTSDWAPAALAFRTEGGWGDIYKLAAFLFLEGSTPLSWNMSRLLINTFPPKSLFSGVKWWRVNKKVYKCNAFLSNAIKLILILMKVWPKVQINTLHELE